MIDQPVYFWGWDSSCSPSKPVFSQSHPHCYGSAYPHKELFWVWECGDTRKEQAKYMKQMGINPNRVQWFESYEEYAAHFS